MGFRTSIPLFRVAGIPVRMDLFLPLFFVLTLVSTPGYRQSAVFLGILTYFGVLAVSAFLHECGHAWAARRDGLGVHEITVSMLGGHTIHDPARTTNSELRVSLAGVAVNVLIALAAGAAIRGLSGALPGTSVTNTFGLALEKLNDCDQVLAPLQVALCVSAPSPTWRLC